MFHYILLLSLFSLAIQTKSFSQVVDPSHSINWNSGANTQCPKGHALNIWQEFQDYSYKVYVDTFPDINKPGSDSLIKYIRQFEYARQIINQNGTYRNVAPFQYIYSDYVDDLTGEVDVSIMNGSSSALDLSSTDKRAIMFTDDPILWGGESIYQSKYGLAVIDSTKGSWKDPCLFEYGYILFPRYRTEGQDLVPFFAPDVSTDYYPYKNASIIQRGSDAGPLVPALMHEILHHYGLGHPTEYYSVAGLMDNRFPQVRRASGLELHYNADYKRYLPGDVGYFLTELENTLLVERFLSSDRNKQREISVSPFVTVSKQDGSSSFELGGVRKNGEDFYERTEIKEGLWESSGVKLNQSYTLFELVVDLHITGYYATANVEYEVYISSNETITDQDYQVATGSIFLYPDVPTTLAIPFVMPHYVAGEYYVGIIVDPNNKIPENTSTDNRAFVPISVSYLESAPTHNFPGDPDQCVEGDTISRQMYPLPSVPYGTPLPAMVTQTATCDNGEYIWEVGEYYEACVFSNLEVSGVLDHDLVALNSPVRVKGDLTVPAGSTINIEAGTTITVEGEFGITIEGEIRGSGDGGENPITFEALSEDHFWKGFTAKPGSTIIMYDWKVKNARKDDDGGALFADQPSFVGIDRSTFINNSASGSGGAFFLKGGSSYHVISRNTFIGNTAGSLGGAIAIAGTDAIKPGYDLEENSFEKNKASRGGAIAQVGPYESEIGVYGSSFIENIAELESGAIYCENGLNKVTIDDFTWPSTFTSNVPNNYSARCKGVTTINGPVTFKSIDPEGGNLDLEFTDTNRTELIEYFVTEEMTGTLQVDTSTEVSFKIYDDENLTSVYMDWTTPTSAPIELGIMPAGTYVIYMNASVAENGFVSLTMDARSTSCLGAPNGTQLTRESWANEEVPFGESCTTVSQPGVCNLGVIDWLDGDYYSSCSVAPPVSCINPETGLPLDHGESFNQKLFLSEAVPQGEQCVFEYKDIVCLNGNLVYPEGFFQNCSSEGSSSPSKHQSCIDQLSLDLNQDGSVDFAGGSGSSEDPFIICNALHLKSLNNLSSLSGQGINYVALGDDIDLFGYEEPGEEGLDLGFLPILPTGLSQFDGRGHSISNLYINRPLSNNVGLFGAIQQGTIIKNLVIESPSITGYWDTAALAGTSWGSVIEDISITKGDCLNGCGVNGHLRVGAVIGHGANVLDANNISNEVDISAEYLAGGLFGKVWLRNADRLTNTGNIIAINYTLGGIVGDLRQTQNGTYSNWSNSGNVSGTSTVGGLIGYLYGTATVSVSMDFVKNTGSLSASNFWSDVGGLVAKVETTNSILSMRDGFNSGEVNGATNVCGGIFAQLRVLSATIERVISTSEGTCTGYNGKIAGYSLVGANGLNFNHVYSSAVATQGSDWDFGTDLGVIDFSNLVTSDNGFDLTRWIDTPDLAVP